MFSTMVPWCLNLILHLPDKCRNILRKEQTIMVLMEMNLSLSNYLYAFL